MDRWLNRNRRNRTEEMGLSESAFKDLRGSHHRSIIFELTIRRGKTLNINNAKWQLESPNNMSWKMENINIKLWLIDTTKCLANGS